MVSARAKGIFYCNSDMPFKTVNVKSVLATICSCNNPLSEPTYFPCEVSQVGDSLMLVACILERVCVCVCVAVEGGLSETFICHGTIACSSKRSATVM